MLVATYADLAGRRAHAGAVGRGIVAIVNRAAHGLDRRAVLLREPRPGTIFANYHVTAVA
jgi:hypothetical protein